jgi:hypothetical protein
MRIYIHQDDQHEAEALETDSDVSIAEALGIVGDETVVALVEDSDELIDVALTFEQAGIPDRAHMFHGKRHKIEAIVVFNGEPKHHEFSASARVKRVFRWAAEKAFDMSKADAAEHQLALASNGTVPPADAHLGSLDQDPAGVVRFNLTPKVRHEG